MKALEKIPENICDIKNSLRSKSNHSDIPRNSCPCSPTTDQNSFLGDCATTSQYRCGTFKDIEKKAQIEKNREMKELERATRTVFVNNLHIRVTEKDLFVIFTQKAGRVLDIYIICDKHTNKSKGLAYVELETIDSMARALGMSGTLLYGQPIQIKPSEMEKNVQWTLQKQAQQGIMTSTVIPAHSTPHPVHGVNVAAAAAAAAALLDGSGNTNNNHSIANQDDQHRKIYIGNLPREINELVLRNMFEPFGAVESSNVIKDLSGKSQGYGFILFRDDGIVNKAIQAMNGILIGSNIIKVNYVTSGPNHYTQDRQLSLDDQRKLPGDDENVDECRKQNNKT
jgi:RNA-binding protein 39